MENVLSPADSRLEPPDCGISERSKTNWLAVGLYGAGVVLCGISLLLPALRVQRKGEWLAGDPGFVWLLLSVDVFPCWAPHFLMIAVPLIYAFAGKTGMKGIGIVLALVIVAVLQDCIPAVVWTRIDQGQLAGFWVWAVALIATTAGLLIGVFSPGSTFSPRRRPVAPPAGHERARGTILLCWAGLALLIVMSVMGRTVFQWGRHYEHLLIPASPDYCPSPDVVANFITGIIDHGHGARHSKIPFAKVTKGAPRTRPLHNPMTGSPLTAAEHACAEPLRVCVRIAGYPGEPS